MADPCELRRVLGVICIAAECMDDAFRGGRSHQIGEFLRWGFDGRNLGLRKKAGFIPIRRSRVNELLCRFPTHAGLRRDMRFLDSDSEDTLRMKVAECRELARACACVLVWQIDEFRELVSSGAHRSLPNVFEGGVDRWMKKLLGTLRLTHQNAMLFSFVEPPVGELREKLQTEKLSPFIDELDDALLLLNPHRPDHGALGNGRMAAVCLEREAGRTDEPTDAEIERGREVLASMSAKNPSVRAFREAARSKFAMKGSNEKLGKIFRDLRPE